MHSHQDAYNKFQTSAPTSTTIWCGPSNPMYPADYLSELEAEEPLAFHKRRQLAEPLVYLFIYFPFRHHEKSNTDFMFQLTTFTWSSASVQSIYLLCLHRMLPCSLQALPTLYFLYSRLHPIYPDLLLLNYSNQHCVSSRPPQSDVNGDQSYNRSRSACRGLNGSIHRPT